MNIFSKSEFHPTSINKYHEPAIFNIDAHQERLLIMICLKWLYEKALARKVVA